MSLEEKIIFSPNELRKIIHLSHKEIGGGEGALQIWAKASRQIFFFGNILSSLTGTDLVILL